MLLNCCPCCYGCAGCCCTLGALSAAGFCGANYFFPNETKKYTGMNFDYLVLFQEITGLKPEDAARLIFNTLYKPTPTPQPQRQPSRDRDDDDSEASTHEHGE